MDASPANVAVAGALDPRDDGAGRSVPYGMLTRLLRRIDFLEYKLLAKQEDAIADIHEDISNTHAILGNIQKARRAREDEQEMGIGSLEPSAPGLPEPSAPSITAGLAQAAPPWTEASPAAAPLPKPSAPVMGHRGPGSYTGSKQPTQMPPIKIDTPEGRDAQRGRPLQPERRTQSQPPQWSWANTALTASTKSPNLQMQRGAPCASRHGAHAAPWR